MANNVKKPDEIITCFNCNLPVKARKIYTNTKTTHIIAAVLIPICMCFIPYCFKLYNDVRYECPACGSLLRFSLH